MKKIVLAASLLAFAANSLDAAPLHGKISFITKRGQRPVLEETVIWLDPVGKEVRKAQAGSFAMTTRSKTLLPHVMAVPVGSTIQFPNEDPISHNLFSLTPGNSFDLGLYRKGAGKSHKFSTPGVINVYCNVHPNMSAVVHVLDTPYYGFADPAGNFTIDAPPGRYRLTAWNEQGGSVTSDVEVRTNGTVTGATSLTIDGRGFRNVQHNNKFGKPYRAPRDY